MIDTSGVGYEQGDAPSRTGKGEEPPYEKKSSGGNSWQSDVAKGIGRLWLPRLVFVLLMIDYGIIAFSKGKKGVKWDDFLVFIVFIVFSIGVFILLVLMKTYWVRSENKEKIIRRIKKSVDKLCP